MCPPVYLTHQSFYPKLAESMPQMVSNIYALCCTVTLWLRHWLGNKHASNPYLCWFHARCFQSLKLSWDMNWNVVYLFLIVLWPWFKLSLCTLRAVCNYIPLPALYKYTSYTNHYSKKLILLALIYLPWFIHSLNNQYNTYRVCVLLCGDIINFLNAELLAREHLFGAEAH